MRNPEWINLLFFAFFLIVASVRPQLNLRRRIKSIAIGATGTALILTAQFLDEYVSEPTASVIHDWLPAPLMLFAYWQAGNLIYRPNEKLQNRLLNFDRKLFGYFHSFRQSPWMKTYLEFTYLFCYPLVPLGLGVLYSMHMGEQSDNFWTAVLPPTYLCHAMVPFTQTLPPWMIESEDARKISANAIRTFNFWIIRHASIHANTLPSAHVAASLAVSLVLLGFVPLVGFIFLWISFSIAVAAIAGRYHYTLDVVTAAILVIVMYIVMYVVPQFWF